ncbi:putative short-chain dehydrogenase [Colletotrichum truncatum]|uniref:Short-chain dehydrogenase n=1 Tax=Colletotrichum truncatum TaxID=5467 RepID=A0ACC3YXT0_COLTU|nr:putative short-chain dehydrogenase [Colletotrichum truncatum]KAF6790923.1 putative short-chain dehydrogenase [Colletotrichum truncatum]
MHSAISLLLAGAGIANAYTIAVAQPFMRKNIDPVVIPGQYKSHMHTFFGSDAVTLNTNTSKELQAGCSTADNPNDFSSYWVPTLYVKDDKGMTPVPFSRFSAYYVAIESAEVAIPQNYKTVAGNAQATSQADVEELAGIQWFCEGDEGETKDAAAWPTKTCSTHLQTLLLFHDCVNEQTLESAYSGTQNWKDGFKPANRCPEGMKRMPQLRFSIRYDLRKVLPEGWNGTPPFELACGNSYCTHGDFINGWLPEAATNMLNANDKRKFAGVDGPNGKYNAGSNCEAKDADPNNGTSDYDESVKMMSGKRSIGQRFQSRRSTSS